MIKERQRNQNPDEFRWGFKKKSEDFALTVREELGISKFSPLDAFALAEYKNIPIYTFDEILHSDEFSRQRNLLNNNPNVSALYTVNRWGEKIILHKNCNSSARQQSNLMHEIAHILLGHLIPEHLLKIASKFKLCYDNTLQEKEAKFLGGCLQLTKPALLWSLKSKLTNEQIAVKYLASLEMVTYRINISGVGKIKGYQSRNK